MEIATSSRSTSCPNPNRIYPGQVLRVGVEQRVSRRLSLTARRGADRGPHARCPRGENLTRIAAHYGVSVASIVQANGIANPSRIFAGQRLVIPGASAVAPAPAAAASAPAAPTEARVHVVSRGENLTRIAAHYGVTVVAIVRANGIANPSRIIGGQRLVIPGASAAAPAPAAAAVPASMAALVSQRDSVRQVIVEEATQ